MKTLLFISIIFLTLEAETIYNGKCVDSFYTSNSNRIYLNYSNSRKANIHYSINRITALVNMQNKFTYDKEDNLCIPYRDNSFISSLVGILIGFSILFFAIFLTIKIGAKR